MTYYFETKINHFLISRKKDFFLLENVLHGGETLRLLFKFFLQIDTTDAAIHKLRKVKFLLKCYFIFSQVCYLLKKGKNVIFSRLIISSYWFTLMQDQIIVDFV